MSISVDSELRTIFGPGAPAANGHTASSADSPDHGEFAPGTTLGRYVLLRVLGEGGMGVVYEAIDPDLSRRVAIKLFRPPDNSVTASVGDSLAQALIIEAKAIAKINHINVVSVYDVGLQNDRVFVAMEFLRGETLKDWCGAKSRTWREILAMYLQIAPGLAAVHDVGMVHRDFKPDNVIVAQDGIPRLIDFGLAHDHRGHSSRYDRTRSGRGSDDTTRFVGVAGTPAYMSPEQHIGEAIGPASDQFSFCVALYEALTGVRPFHGESMMELAWATQSGRIDSLPSSVKVPRWLLHIVRRGLAPKIHDRYASMDHLIQALSHSPTRFRMMALGMGVVFVLAGNVAAEMQREQIALEKRCMAIASTLDASWDALEKKSRIDPNLQEFRLSQSWGQVAYALKQRSESWTRAQFDLCLAQAGAKPRASTVSYDQQQACLDSRQSDVQAVLDAMGEPQGLDWSKMVDVVDALPTVGSCSDPTSEHAHRLRPSDPVLARGVSQIRGQLQAVLRRFELGQHAGLDAEIRGLLGRPETQAFPPLRAEILIVAGDIFHHQGDPEELVKWGQEAADIAERYGRDKDVVAALHGLVFTVGYRLQDFAGAQQILRHASAHARRLASPEPLLADLYASSVSVHVVHGQLQRAAELARASMRMRSHLDATGGTTLNNWGVALYYMGKFAQSAELLERSIRIDQATRVEGSPQMVYPFSNLSLIFAAEGNFDTSLQYAKDALQHAKRSEMPVNEAIVRAHRQLAEILSFRGQYGEALQENGLATQLHAEMFGAEHSYLFIELSERAGIHLRAGQLEEALDAAQEAWRRIEIVHADAGRVQEGSTAYCILAEVYFRHSMAERGYLALKRAQEQIDLRPDEAPTLLACPARVEAQWALDRGDLPAAEAALQRASQVPRPRFLERYWTRQVEARWALESGQVARAVAAYDWLLHQYQQQSGGERGGLRELEAIRVRLESTNVQRNLR